MRGRQDSNISFWRQSSWLSQVVYDQPAKSEEYYDTSPEYPFVLFCSSFYHADSVSTDAQRIGYTVEFLLRTLHHLPLLSEVSEDGTASLYELIKLSVGRRHEVLFSQRVCFSVV